MATFQSSKSIGKVVALIAMVVGDRLADSTLASLLKYGGLGYLTLDIVLQARAGYLRRRPYWTVESWRLYLKACVIPLVALLVLAALLAAHSLGLPLVGEPRSATRGVFVAVTVVVLLITAVTLATAIGWLGNGEPSRQFTPPRWGRFVW